MPLGHLAGTGKTYISPIWLAQEIAKYPKENWLLLAPTFNVLMAATLPSLLRHYQGTTLQGTFHAGRMIYELPDGGKIYCRSCDSPHSFQGVVSKGIVIDEAALISETAWNVCRQRVAFRQGRILVISTPYSCVGWLKDCVDKAKAGDPEYDYINCSCLESPWFPKDEYYARQKDMPPDLFNMLFNGQFGLPLRAVYPTFNHENIKETNYDPSLPLVVGSDFNVGDMSWCIGQCKGDEFHVIDEIVIKYNARTPLALDTLYDKYNSHRAGFIFCGDASSRARHTSAAISDYLQIEQDQRFSSLGRTIKFPESNPAVADRINAVNAMIYNAAGRRRLFIDPKCVQTKNHIQMAQYKEATRDVDKSRFDPHMADSLGYIIYQLYPIVLPQQPVTINTIAFR